MANRGMSNSVSSMPISMGECGTAYVDLAEGSANLCFDIPLITTGGATPISLSLYYNRQNATVSLGDMFADGYRAYMDGEAFDGDQNNH